MQLWKNKKIWMIIILTILLVGVYWISTRPNAVPLKEAKIIILLSGSADDQNWNMTNREGVEACNEAYGIHMQYIENVKESNFESMLSAYGKLNYDLIIAAGAQFSEAVETVAPSYKQTIFCVVNGNKMTGTNVVSVQPKEYEASYLAALIAGCETENGQFAAIGGYPNDAMEKLMDVYETTAIETAVSRGYKDASSRRAYTNSWDDAELGKKITEQMIEDDADVVFVYANQVGLGCIEAAAENGIKFIGFSSNQNAVDESTVVASVVFDFEKLYRFILERYENRTLTNHRLYQIGMDEELFCPVYSEQISEETKQLVEDRIEDLKQGKISL